MKTDREIIDKNCKKILGYLGQGIGDKQGQMLLACMKDARQAQDVESRKSGLCFALKLIRIESDKCLDNPELISSGVYNVLDKIRTLIDKELESSHEDKNSPNGDNHSAGKGKIQKVKRLRYNKQLHQHTPPESAPRHTFIAKFGLIPEVVVYSIEDFQLAIQKATEGTIIEIRDIWKEKKETKV